VRKLSGRSLLSRTAQRFQLSVLQLLVFSTYFLLNLANTADRIASWTFCYAREGKCPELLRRITGGNGLPVFAAAEKHQVALICRLVAHGIRFKVTYWGPVLPRSSALSDSLWSVVVRVYTP